MSPPAIWMRCRGGSARKAARSDFLAMWWGQQYGTQIVSVALCSCFNVCVCVCLCVCCGYSAGTAADRCPEERVEALRCGASAGKAAQISGRETEETRTRSRTRRRRRREEAPPAGETATAITNKAAAHFEAGSYQLAIETCEQAIEHGREVRADFKIIAKAFARIGSSYEKLGEPKKAIDNYNKSLTEHRTADTLNKLKAAEAALEARTKKDYESPEKAEEARVAGNDAFKASNFPDAVKQYSEMIKRAPADARGYANRAAAYIKLMSMPEAIKDCDKATTLDPSFVKAYIRKATALLTMREYGRATTELDQATAHDTEKKHTTEISQLSYKIQSALYEERSKETEEQQQQRIANDPEVMSILQDPVMQSILQQAQQNPSALNEHMKNPAIASKIRKLMDSGVIRTR